LGCSVARARSEPKTENRKLDREAVPHLNWRAVGRDSLGCRLSVARFSVIRSVFGLIKLRKRKTENRKLKTENLTAKRSFSMICVE